MKFAAKSLFLLSLPFATPAIAAPANCPIDRAIYTQADNDDVEAGFTRQIVPNRMVSDLVFFVRNKQHTLWFAFSSPNGYGGTYIDEQPDPKLIKAYDDRDEQAAETDEDDGSRFMPFDAFDAKLTAFTSPPTSKDKAPAYLFSRELGPYIHYGQAGATMASDPLSVEIGMWRLTGCRKD